MAITIDNTAAFTHNGNGTTFSWNHTLGTLTDGALIVAINIEDQPVSGVTVTLDKGGANQLVLTEIGSGSFTSGYTQESFLFMGLDAGLPAAGTYSITVDYTNNTDPDLVGGSISINGYTAQTVPTGAAISGAGANATSVALTPTTANADAFVVLASNHNSNTSFNAIAGYTEVQDAFSASQTGYMAYGTEASAGAKSISPTVAGSANRMSGFAAVFESSGAASFVIDTIPTTINADGSFDVVVSNPATVPTTGNTAIKLTDASGQAATINSVTGSDPYTISGTFPRATTNALFGDYALYVEVDAENATSGGTASYEPASGWSYVDVGTIDTSSEIYTQYSAGTIATGWQAVIKSPTNEDSVTVTMTDDLNYTFGPYVGSTDQTTEFYAINASGTVLAEETITFDFTAVGVPVLSSPTGTATGAATASGTVTTDDGTGTLYFYASTNSTETAATIKASGSSQAVGVSGSQGVGVTGLTPETLYYLHYVQDDDGAQESNVVSSSSFTTLATSDVPPTSRTSIFHIANYLRSLGTYNSSQCNELVVEWLVSEGITRTQINQMLYGYLGGLGYTGSFNDRLKAWSEDV